MLGFHHGQSLVEVLIGAALGALLIAGGAALIVPALRSTTQVVQVQTESQLGKELADNVKAWAAGNWNNLLALATGTANTYYLNATSSPFVAVASGTSIIGTSSAALAMDVNIAASSTAGTPKTSAFSTTGPNELLVAFLSSDCEGASAASSLAGAGLAWTKVISYTASGYGMVTIWSAFASASLSNVTVNATTTGCSFWHALLNVMAFINATSTVGASATSSKSTGAPSSTLMTTNNNSWVFGVGEDWNNAIARTVGPNQTISAEYVDGEGSDHWMQRENNTTPVAGTLVTLNDTAPTTDNSTWALVEIVPTLLPVYGPGSGGGVEQVTVGSAIYDRYFYLNDVYRDASGNATTTPTGNSYDPSTKQVTVVVTMASSTGASVVLNMYLARDASNVFNQTSWIGGAGQSSPVTLAPTTYASSVSVGVNATGSFQLAGPPGGNACQL